MALRKPVVINSGQLEQLQSGDTLDGLTSENGINVINDNVGAIVIGTPVYAAAADHVDKAKADAIGTVNVVGLMQETSTASGGTGFMQVTGILDATTVQWDAVVTGGAGGLVFNTIYYLDPSTAGKLTSTAPTTAGQFVKEIGIALSTTEMQLANNSRRVKL